MNGGMSYAKGPKFSLCFYCEVPLTTGSLRKGKRRMTRDHVVPKSSPMFGLLTPYQHALNVVECCRECNGEKADMTPFKWARRISPTARVRLASRLTMLGFTSGVAFMIVSGVEPDIRLVTVNG